MQQKFYGTGSWSFLLLIDRYGIKFVIIFWLVLHQLNQYHNCNGKAQFKISFCKRKCKCSLERCGNCKLCR